MDVLGEFGAGERLADAVVADVGDLDQAIEQAERLENAGIDADADIGVAGFDSLQRRAGREGALGDDGHRQPPTTSGVMDVRAELAQGPPNGGRGIVGGRAFAPFMLHIWRICSTKTTNFLVPAGVGTSV